MKILSFGEIIWDVYPDKACIGGAPLNFSAHLAKQGATSFLLSAVGKDRLGDDALTMISDFGVHTDYIARLDKPTGQCTVTLNEKRVPHYKIEEDTAYDYIAVPQAADDFDAFSFGTLAQRSSENVKALNDILEAFHFKDIFCDINIRPPFYSKDNIAFCLSHATLAKISREELPVITTEMLGAPENDYRLAARKLSTTYPQLKAIIITLDKDGAYVYDALTDTDNEAPSLPVKVVSTVGAGDSFGAAFLYHYLSGESMSQCLAAAVALSSFVVSRAEAIPD